VQAAAQVCSLVHAGGESPFGSLGGGHTGAQRKRKCCRASAHDVARWHRRGGWHTPCFEEDFMGQRITAAGRSSRRLLAVAIGFGAVCVLLGTSLVIGCTPSWSQGCAGDAECGAGQVCAPLGGGWFGVYWVCVTPCSVHSDCESGWYCSLVDPVAAPGIRGECRIGCRNSSECGVGQYCFQGTCVTDTHDFGIHRDLPRLHDTTARPDIGATPGGRKVDQSAPLAIDGGATSQ